jgi:membrane protein implicated in regulation of membrane protease activity
MWPAEETLMHMWVVWLLLAVVLGVAELLTLTFALGLLAAAAVAAGLSGALGLPTALQVVVFAVTAGAGLVVVRPIALRHLRQPPSLRTGVAALVGREAVTLTEVTRHGGRARIGGEEWSARPYDPDSVIPVGVTVDVLAIEGATALIYPREASP